MEASRGEIDPNTCCLGDELRSVPPGWWQIQRLQEPLRLHGNADVEYGKNVHYGRRVYLHRHRAVEAAKQIPGPCDGERLSLLVVQQGCTDLADTDTAVFLNWYDGRWA